MGDMRETFELMREAARRKREDNKTKSIAILTGRGVPFEVRNAGYHLVIRRPEGVVNFFPSTGRYTGVFDGRGVFNLLREMELQNKMVNEK